MNYEFIVFAQGYGVIASAEKPFEKKIERAA
jgi:hypothetical protein